MLLLPISVNNISKVYNINFIKQKKVEQKEEEINYTNYALGALGVCAIGLGAVFFSKNKVISSQKLSEADKKFFENIQKSLKKSGIDAKIEDLKSIVAPDEFKILIKKFKPEHFNVGIQVSEAKAKDIPLEEFYKNAINGDFRVSLHTHSNFSDGKATIEEFLESARKYADKVAKLNKNDGLPPFTLALTDHDGVKGCQEIIKIIAKNPEKY